VHWQTPGPCTLLQRKSACEPDNSRSKGGSEHGICSRERGSLGEGNSFTLVEEIQIDFGSEQQGYSSAPSEDNCPFDPGFPQEGAPSPMPAVGRNGDPAHQAKAQLDFPRLHDPWTNGLNATGSLS
jgi:hypothetical protein